MLPLPRHTCMIVSGHGYVMYEQSVERFKMSELLKETISRPRSSVDRI